jgi:serine protease AprX
MVSQTRTAWVQTLTAGALATAITAVSLVGGAPAHAYGGGGYGGGGYGGGGYGDGGYGGYGGSYASGAQTWDDTTTTASPMSSALTRAGVDRVRSAGWTSKGVGIAMIDTGVAPVAGLTSGNVVNGPDLSLESQYVPTRYVDTNGHGTHLAGIMVGKPVTNFTGGVAPGAKLTSLKVGARNGAVDVTQVIAAIDWVVEHRNDDAANKIRVLELAYGTDSTQASTVDPLMSAVENAWRAGITVVVAGGNSGAAQKLLSPARDPYVLSVGASQEATVSSYRSTQTVEQVTDFSNRGDSGRHLDVMVPGRSLVSLRAPGSAADTEFSAARVGTLAFKGSGSSQAAAFAAGAVALLLQARPTLTPDDVKYVLRNSGVGVTGDTAVKAVNLKAALDTPVGAVRTYYGTTTVNTKQSFAAATGKGTFEAARGTMHVYDDLGNKLAGENDLFGPLSTSAWSIASGNQTAWVGGTWMGREWTGNGWTTVAWWRDTSRSSTTTVLPGTRPMVTGPASRRCTVVVSAGRTGSVRSVICRPRSGAPSRSTSGRPGGTGTVRTRSGPR